MWKSIDINCPECGVVAQTVDVPSGTSLLDSYECELCGTMSPRKISFTIAKQDIQEKTHGGEFIGTKYVSKSTASYNRTKEQLDIKKKMAEEKKRGNKEGFVDAAMALSRKQEEAVKRIGKD